MNNMRLILASVLLVSFVSISSGNNLASAGEDKKVIRDDRGLFIGSTRQSGDRIIVRDSYGRNVGSVDKDGRITDPYGKLLGSVREKDD